MAYAINAKEKRNPRYAQAAKVQDGMPLARASEFVPLDGRKDASPIVLTVDEFEALRLIDGEDYSQEQCGEQMHIARATVQQIVDSARKKISFALVEGRPLKILGGEYRLCEGGAGALRLLPRGVRALPAK